MLKCVRFPGAWSDAGLAGNSPLVLDEYIFRPVKPYITSVVTLREGGVSAKRKRVRRLDWVRLSERKEQRGIVRCMERGLGLLVAA